MDLLPLNVCASIIRLLDARSLGRLRYALGSNARKNGDIDRMLKSAMEVQIIMIIDHILYQAATAIITFFDKLTQNYSETSTCVRIHIGEYSLYCNDIILSYTGYLLNIKQLNDIIIRIPKDNKSLYPALLHILREELVPETLPLDNDFMKEFQIRWKRMFDHPVNSFIKIYCMRVYDWLEKPFLLRAMIHNPIWIKLTSSDEIYRSLNWMENRIKFFKEQLRAAEELTATITSLYDVF